MNSGLLPLDISQPSMRRERDGKRMREGRGMGWGDERRERDGKGMRGGRGVGRGDERRERDGKGR